MRISDIAQIIREMRGRMPDSSRTMLAMKFVNLFGKDLTTSKDGAKIKEWADEGGVQAFLKDCDLLSSAPFCNHEISVHDTDLANFINKWMNVDKFREPGGEYQPITPEMHSIRTLMVEELKNLYNAQKRITDHDNRQVQAKESDST